MNVSTIENEAIIYLPGLPQVDEKQSLHSFAYRVKKSLDINSTLEKDRYELEVKKTNYGKDKEQECNIATIFKINDHGKIKVYDIYELSYCNDLIRKFEELNHLYKTILLFSAVMAKLPRFLFAVFSHTAKGIRLRDKIQTLYVGCILFCISFYGIMLFTALIVSVEEPMSKFFHSGGNIMKYYPADTPTVSILQKYAFRIFPEEKVLKFISAAGKYWRYSVTFINDLLVLLWQIPLFFFHFAIQMKEWIIGSAALFFLLLPNMRNIITKTATRYICLYNYLNVGERRLNIIGKLEEILELASENDKPYQRLHIHSFSFGSVIALDALFPYDGIISERLKKIDSLITVGCPFDFIRVYWPNYYKRENVENFHHLKWYNVYSSVDILSSNFRDDSIIGDATKSIGNINPPVNVPFNTVHPEDVKTWEVLTLIGLKAHSLYWENELYSASYLTNLFHKMKPFLAILSAK